jgi:hypothetical protein
LNRAGSGLDIDITGALKACVDRSASSPNVQVVARRSRGEGAAARGDGERSLRAFDDHGTRASGNGRCASDALQRNRAGLIRPASPETMLIVPRMVETSSVETPAASNVFSNGSRCAITGEPATYIASTSITAGIGRMSQCKPRSAR